MKKILLISSALVAISLTANAQEILGGGGGTGGGAGTVTTTGSPASGDIAKVSGSSSVTTAVPGTDYAQPGVGTYITTNTTATAANWGVYQVITLDAASLTVTLPVSSTLATNGGLIIVAKNAGTLAINAADAIDGGTAGASKALAAGQAVVVTTNGSGKITTGNATASGGSGTVNSGTAASVAVYASTGAAVSDGSTGIVNIGALNVSDGSAAAPANGLRNIGSGTMRLMANSVNMADIVGSGPYMSWNVDQSVAAANGPSIRNVSSSATVPGIDPNKSDATTGWGSQAAGNMSGIAAGVEKIRMTAEGVQYKQTTAPVPTGTGTPTIATGSTDEAGQVTAGTAATSVIITFNLTHTNAPFCVVTDQTNLAVFTYTLTNTAITITQTANSANKINYRCTFP
jgi:hypothetical protein